MTYQFTKYNGTQIHYELRGEGTAVTFIHAGVSNLHLWDDQMDAFSARYQVLRYDMRGWGATVRPDVNFSHHEDLRALLDHVGIEKTAVVGCSWGGKIAIDFALTYPERISALVLVGAALGGYEWTSADFAEKDAAMEAAYECGDKALAAELETQIWFDGPQRSPEQVDPISRKRAYALSLHTLELPEGGGAWQELEPPAIHRLAEIQVPVKIIVGQYDVADIQAISELLAEKIPLPEERTFMLNTAHLPNLERPSKFNEIVLGFLDKVSWRSDIYAILPHEQEAKVWLEACDNGYTLPHITLPGRLENLSETNGQQLLRNKLGNIQLLYSVPLQENEEAKTAASIFVLDNVGANVENGRWVNQQTLQTIPLSQPHHKDLIETCLQEWETGVLPVLRPPWAKRGWYAQAEFWIKSALSQKEQTLVKPLETVRNWCLSYVMRAQTSNGDFYFKTVADLPLFVNEAVVVNNLAQLFPQHILAPIAMNAEQDWLLLPALPQILGWGATFEHRLGFMQQFVRLQKTAVSHIDQLLTATVHDRRLAWMQTQIEALLTAEFCQLDLTAEEVSDLINLIPFLQTLLAELAAAPIPQTLVHGDLHGDNIGLQNGTYIFFDWTDACISHPFFDMIDIFFEKDTAVQNQLRDAYLAEWTDFASMPELLDIWTIAEVGAAIHHALSYWQIQIHIEPHAREDMRHMIPFWLRKILALSKNFGETTGRY